MAEYGTRIKVREQDYIPYAVIEPHERQAESNHYQSLETLERRGGLSYCEALAVLEDRPWSRVEQNMAKQRVFEIVSKFDGV